MGCFSQLQSDFKIMLRFNIVIVSEKERIF